LRYVRLVSAVLSLAAASAVAATPAIAATTKPPTITSSFTPNLIGVGDTTALGITLTNPNTSGTLSGVGFNDTLPTGLAIDNPSGENGTCGTAGVVTAAPGTQTFSLSGGSLKAGASCTVSVAVTASEPEVVQNDTGPASSSAGNSVSSGDTEVLTVLASPTATIVKPANHARYNYRQVVRANYSCGQAGYTLGIQSCSALDDLGNTIADGGRLVTNVAGAHQLTVYSISVDGDVTTASVNYTVLPDNQFTVSKVKPKSGGSVSFEVGLPGAGKVLALALAGKKIVAKTNVAVHGKRQLQVRLKPTGLGTGGATVQLKVTYTPKGGEPRTVTVRGVKLS
jgi:hypothetical protein